MAYFCQCGERLKPIKLPNRKKVTEKWISYKVLMVETKRGYKCPNGCELKSITQA